LHGASGEERTFVAGSFRLNLTSMRWQFSWICGMPLGDVWDFLYKRLSRRHNERRVRAVFYVAKYPIGL